MLKMMKVKEYGLVFVSRGPWLQIEEMSEDRVQNQLQISVAKTEEEDEAEKENIEIWVETVKKSI